MNKFSSTGKQMLFWNCIGKSIHRLQDVLSENKKRRKSCLITEDSAGNEHKAMSAAVKVCPSYPSSIEVENVWIFIPILN
jgi:hypothetical protein